MNEATDGAKTFWGKYRGTVLNNIDPEQRGRLTLTVPDVLGPVPSSWAEPVVPLAGPTGPPMGVYLVPPIGAGVWVEFEHGNPDHPIWVIVMQTAGQNSLVISDLPGPTGGIMLKSTTGATIIVNDTGIYIQNGKGASLVMTGPTVTINNGALVVV
jgi:hypothetical protein